MRLPRFTISSLLGVVLFVAVALAALRASTDAWDGGVLGLTVLTLLTAVLLAVHRAGRKRAFWLGFSLFGWAYLVVCLIPPVESRLPTTKGLAYLDSRVPGRTVAYSVNIRWPQPGAPGNRLARSQVIPDLTRANPTDFSYSWMFTGVPAAGTLGTTENFIRIGHSLLALVFGAIGGRLSRLMHDQDLVGAGDGVHPRDERRRR